MTDSEPTSDTTPTSPEPKHMLAPLIRSLPAASIVYVFLILGFVLSTLLFLFQLRYEVEPGILLIDSHSGRLLVFGHLFRATAFLLLAWSLRKYLSSLRCIRRNEPNAFEKFVNASRSWWNTVFFNVLLILVYGSWALIVHFDPFADFPGGKHSHPGNSSDDFAGGSEVLQRQLQPDVQVEFYLAETSPGEGLEEHVIHATGDSIWLPLEPVLSNEHFLEAEVNLDQYKNPTINVKLNQEGAALISKASQKHRSKPLAILVDRKIIMAPTIHDAVGSEFTISGSISLEEAERIARSLSRKQ
ncbi:SecDF P1 head subdomain-containing protein [Gimesia maris]|uniref:SecDF P1 head subdomain-containing protein n=1 Tax=Gimesia maris TaxID=122 RepID=UPI002420425B|nr:hypothetical protein [Gimesia maris]